jgi:hypothetical protein
MFHFWYRQSSSEQAISFAQSMGARAIEYLPEILSLLITRPGRPWITLRASAVRAAFERSHAADSLLRISADGLHKVFFICCVVT